MPDEHDYKSCCVNVSAIGVYRSAAEGYVPAVVFIMLNDNILSKETRSILPVFTEEAKLLAGMALLRLIAGTIEISGSLLMLKFQRIETAIQINAVLGLIGPSIFVLVSAIGIAGLAGKISYTKLLFVAGGVLLILMAARK